MAAFTERRAQTPDGQERIEGVIGLITEPVFSLHYGSLRAATWHDRTEDVVWLLAVTDHDYEQVESLARRGQLLPTLDDYDQFDAPELESAQFLRRLTQDVRVTIARAAASPDHILVSVLAGRVPVRVCVESGEPPFLAVAVGRRLISNGPDLPADWMYLVANTFFPGRPVGDLVDFTSFIDGEPVRADEMALRDFATDTLA